MTDMTVRDTLFEQFGALASKDQWWFMTKAMAVLQKESKPKKSKKADKEDSASEGGDSAVPKQKKEPNDWIKHVSYMRPIMNILAETDPDAKKAKAVTQVAKMLKESGNFFTSQAEAQASVDIITATFARWKSDPPSSAASVASKEEKKDKKEKNKAIREAKKLAEKAAAPASAPAVPAPSTPAKAATAATAEDGITTPPKIRRIIKKKVAEKPTQGEAEKWEHDFGSGMIVYDRFHVAGTNTYHIYDPKDGHIGIYDETENELNPDVTDPLLE
jgi:hypothetical protein